MGGLPGLLVCADFGSTYTKVALLDTGAARVLGTAQRPTSLDGDILLGYDEALAELAVAHPAALDATAVSCSSAGGGLRIAVVGNEELVTAEAGRRVALSSGGKVVLVLSGGLDADRMDRLDAAAPDIVLLVGGTDGGNAEQLRADAATLAARPTRVPVVVAGDVESRDAVVDVLAAAGVPCVPAANVVPRIGAFAPDGARAAIRAAFLEHVIGGKELTARPEFVARLLGPTPDVVLVGAEVLAEAHGAQRPGSGVVVVDVGGATTDVYSVLVPDPEERELAHDVVGIAPVTRTVEGDLGVNASAEGTRAVAETEGLAASTDEELAGAALALAVRRHAGRARVVLSADGRVVERTGVDLREADLLVGSGGVLRAAGAARSAGLLAASTGTHPDGWQLPTDPRIVLDADYVLAPAGLLVLFGRRIGEEEAARDVARRLLSTRLLTTGEPITGTGRSRT